MRKVRSSSGMLAISTILTLGCGRAAMSPTPGSDAGSGSSRAPAPAELFVDIAPQCGLEFVHWNGMTGKKYFVEPVAAGGAVLASLS